MSGKTSTDSHLETALRLCKKATGGEVHWHDTDTLELAEAVLELDKQIRESGVLPESWGKATAPVYTNFRNQDLDDPLA